MPMTRILLHGKAQLDCTGHLWLPVICTVRPKKFAR